MKTNTFKNLKSPYVQGETDIDTILDYIKDGLTKQNTLKARSHGKGTPEYDEIKSQTPTFSPNASFNEKRCQDNLKTLSGFIYIDVDENINPIDIQFTSYIYACWRSFGGTGWGALASVKNLTTDNFKDVWLDIEQYFKTFGITIDPLTKDIPRQNIISYDPDIFINPCCVPIDANSITISSSSSNFVSSSTLYDPNLFDGNSTNTFFKSEKLKYKTTLDDYQNQAYIVIEEGKDSRDSFLPKEIREGKRKWWLNAFINTLIFNNPHISLTTLEKQLLRANKYNCNPNLEVSEVIQMVKKKHDKHIKGMLDINTKKKYIWYNPLSELTREEKRIITGKEGGIIKKNRTIKKLREIYAKLKVDHEKVTQVMVTESSDKGISTVKKYWVYITEGTLCR